MEVKQYIQLNIAEINSDLADIEADLPSTRNVHYQIQALKERIKHLDNHGDIEQPEREQIEALEARIAIVEAGRTQP